MAAAELQVKLGVLISLSRRELQKLVMQIGETILNLKDFHNKQ